MFRKFYCKSLIIKVILSLLRLLIYLTWKTQFQSLWNLLLYVILFVCPGFVCPGFNVCYIGETTHYLSTRIKEHLEADKKPHIFAHIVNKETCKTLSTDNCFEIIDSASIPLRLKLKETMRRIWKKPSLKKQQNYVSISITV